MTDQSQYHYLEVEERLRVQDRILEIVGEKTETFEDTLDGSVLTTGTIKTPETIAELVREGCKVRSDDVGLVNVILPYKKRFEGRLLDGMRLFANLAFAAFVFNCFVYFHAVYFNENVGI